MDCNSSAKHIKHMLYWIQVWSVFSSIHTGDILRLKAFVYNVCTNDIRIDVASHCYTLNMKVSSGTKNNSSPNARAILHYRNGVVQWCSLGGNGYLAISILKSGENQTANQSWTRRKTLQKTTVVVSTMHALYSRLIAGDSELR
ncbi:hypothetical protein TNCV_1634921 [Trichonephila clavipes]|nr:hypothetical protein TNCV_1634921 [Trichonephila clavipes]